MTELDPRLPRSSAAAPPPCSGDRCRASAAWPRPCALARWGYRVTVIDRLDVPGGRGSASGRTVTGSISAPPSSPCRSSSASSGPPAAATSTTTSICAPLDPFYEIRWPDGSYFQARQDTDAMREEVRRLSPRDVQGLRAVPQGQRGALLVRVRGSGPALDAPVPRSARHAADLRADAGGPLGLCPCRAAGHGRAPAHGAVVPSPLHRRRSVQRDLDVHPRQPPREGVRRPLRDGRRRRDRPAHGRDRSRIRADCMRMQSEVDEILVRDGRAAGCV